MNCHLTNILIAVLDGLGLMKGLLKVIGDGDNVGAESAWRLVLIVRLHLHSQLSASIRKYVDVFL